MVVVIFQLPHVVGDAVGFITLVFVTDIEIAVVEREPC